MIVRVNVNDVCARGITTTRHRKLQRAAEIFYRIPAFKRIARRTARLVIQRSRLSLKSKQRIYNFLAKPTIPGTRIRCVAPLPAGGVRLDLDLNDDLSRMWYFWGYGGYEPETVRTFSRLVRTKRVVFDIGANVGYYALLAARLIGKSGQVHAFEPNPCVFEALYRNVHANDELRNLFPNQIAISDSDGHEQLFLPSDSAWTNASLVERFTSQSRSMHVNASRLDTYCSANAIARIDLLKIDVEGAELKVLRGMGDLLDAWAPDIICEVLEPYEEELETFFSGRPYQKFLINGQKPQRRDRIEGHAQFRDWYLSCSPQPDLF